MCFIEVEINVKRFRQFREREAEDDRKFLRERGKKRKRIERVINVHITCELSDSRLYKLEAL